MKVYRGPSSKQFHNESHELVAEIPPTKLEEWVRTSALFQFNISKESNQRQAVCTAKFEEADMIPMIQGLLARLSAQQLSIAKIRDIVSHGTMDSDEKVREIFHALPQS